MIRRFYRHSSRLTASLLALLLMPPVAIGQDERPPNYEVEVIIFAYASPAAGGEEMWPARLAVPRLKGVLELLPPPLRVMPAGVDERNAVLLEEDFGSLLAPPTETSPQPTLPPQARQFQLLDPQSLRMTQEAARLERSGRYRVLWHSAWRQPGLAPEQALAVHVRAGEPTELPLVDLTRNVPIDALLAADLSIEPPGLFGETRLLDAVSGIRLPPSVLLPPDRRRIRVYPLDGSLRLEMGRYLHLYTDLILTEAVGILPGGGQRGNRLDGANAEALQSFPMRAHRRMRSGEMHHIDHPVLGVLVLTTRLEAEPRAESAIDPAADEAADAGR